MTKLFKSAFAMLAAVAATALPVAHAQQDGVLTERIMGLSLDAVKLSALAYANATEYAVFDDSGNITSYTHPDYPEIHFYNQEPDQAIVARTEDGHCFVAFRGTSLALEDWQQNINLEDINLHKDNDGAADFCEGRAGYSDFIRTSVVAQAQADMLNCTARCSDIMDCLVITGHSQGGASASHLSILTYSQFPTVITFGMPPALDADCDLVPSERFFRFVNFRQEVDEDDDIGFDPVPFSPTFVSNSVHYGHFLLVGPDDAAVKYLGFDDNYTFTPDLLDRTEIAAHSLSEVEWSYEARITSLLNKTNQSFPISQNGFSNGIICEPGYFELCESGSCQNNQCADKIAELCIKESCDEDEDCETGFCIYGACATGEGEVQPGCPCARNFDCASKDCDTKLLEFSLDWTCEPFVQGTGSGGNVVWGGGGMVVSVITVGMFVVSVLLLH